MGNVIEGDFRDMDSFNNEMETIVDGFVECLTKYFEELSDEELEYAHKYAVEKEKIYLSEQLKKGIHGR